MMRRIMMICAALLVMFSGRAQTVYSWTPGVNPGWTSSDNYLRWRGACSAVTTNCTGNYVNFANSTYTSGVIDATCTNASTVNVSFDILGESESGYDFLFFEYSPNGTVWTNFYGPGIGLAGSTFGATINWVLPAVPSLSTFYVRLRFQSDFSFTYQGFRITNFSIDCNVVLPVELQNFSGSFDNKNVNLSWETASEINNSHFEIERSIDGVEWTKIGEEKGVGNSSVLSSYSFQDKESIKGKINYYRLKQVDFDGKFEYSEIIAIENTSAEPVLIGTYNLMGQPVNSSYTGIVIDLFSDGTKIKRFVHP